MEYYYPAQASSLRKGGYIVIKERPCKIIDMSTSKTGKHGHAKIHFIATDIFTKKRLDELCTSTHNINVPYVKRQDYMLLDIDDEDYMSLMIEETAQTKDDLQLDTSDICFNIRKDFDKEKELIVSVIASMGEEAVCDYKEASKF
jgi:translation initiation factor 5A